MIDQRRCENMIKTDFLTHLLQLECKPVDAERKKIRMNIYSNSIYGRSWFVICDYDMIKKGLLSQMWWERMWIDMWLKTADAVFAYLKDYPFMDCEKHGIYTVLVVCTMGTLHLLFNYFYLLVLLTIIIINNHL